MSASKLPERASLEYLKKLAKDRLAELRRNDPSAKLTTAQLAIARDHGFPSWRALKAEIDRRQSTGDRFVEACAVGDLATLRALLDADPLLVRAEKPGPYRHWNLLHSAAQVGRLDVVKLLLERGADPNAREDGDHTYPLHWAAAGAFTEVVRTLLDAGTDPIGAGDDHALDVIGWACCFDSQEPFSPARRETVALLLERGARHHIFSAIATGDLDTVRQVIAEHPESLDRRRSRFENRETPIHYAMSRGRYDIVEFLVAMGADLEAEDGNGNTALTTAMMRGDREAVRLLRAAGAKPQKGWDTTTPPEKPEPIVPFTKCVPMITVPDIARTLDWYVALGFQEIGRFGDDAGLNWGMFGLGKAEVMLRPGGGFGPHEINLWFYTDQIDRLYETLKSRQIEAMSSSRAATLEFIQDLYNPPYGGREFGIRDLNGYAVYFYQP